MSSPVAIVTGAASGMGLALTHHLVAKGWKFGMVDVNPAGEKLSQYMGANTCFKKVDVTKYDQLSTSFTEIWRWGGGRLDFLAANAGIRSAESVRSQTASRSPRCSAPTQHKGSRCHDYVCVTGSLVVQVLFQEEWRDRRQDRDYLFVSRPIVSTLHV